MQLPDHAFATLPPLLRSELKPCSDPVAEHLEGAESLLGGLMDFRPDEFVLRAPSGRVRFHYRRGTGVAAWMDGPEYRDEADIYLSGTVLGSVAWMNGFCPLHAGAVTRGDRTLAFTAPSGGGKSTLIAALGDDGWSHVCDDTLVLDVQDDAILAYPDGKTVKLWEDSLAFIAPAASRPIALLPGKSRVVPRAPTTSASPLTDLLVLQEGPEIAVSPICGAEKARVVAGAFYRPAVHAAMRDNARHVQFVSRLAGGLRLWQFTRPLEPRRFSEGIVLLLQALDRG